MKNVGGADSWVRIDTRIGRAKTGADKTYFEHPALLGYYGQTRDRALSHDKRR